MRNFDVSVMAKRIKELRESKGLSQKDLADKFLVKQSVISKYERGVVNPSYDVLFKLAQVLDTTTDYLLGLTDFD